MSISKIQTGDKVKVISGPFKGHVGFVTKVIKKIKRKGLIVRKASVSDVKQLTDYQKSNKSYGVPGSKGLKDRFIDVSNISLVDETGKVSKVKIVTSESGKKRVFKTTGKDVKKQPISKNDKKEVVKKETKTTKK